MNRAGRAGSMLASIALALAACGPSSQREKVVGDPTVDMGQMGIEELEALLWPKTPEHWRQLSKLQLLALEELVSSLLGHARKGGMTDAQERRAMGLAKMVGMQLHTITLEHDGWTELMWLLMEPAEDRRGRGSYLFRIGERTKDVPRTEYLLEAPHSRYDRYTGIIALSLFAEGDTRPARALFVNSVHRYAQPDGSRGRLEPARANLADAAHNEEHPLARATARVLREFPLALVQLHGFEQDAEANDPDIIVGSGMNEPSRATTGTVERLRAEFPEIAIGLFGVDTARLGATTNVQGHASRDARRCFVHVEASEAVRKQLRDDREARRRFAQSLFGSSRQELRGGCR